MENTEKLGFKQSLFHVLNGTATGIVVGLIPNAVLGELFKAFDGAFFEMAYQVVYSLQFATAAAVGVLVAVNFGFNAMQAAAVGTAAFVGSGAVTFKDGIWVGGGIGDLINVMITAGIACWIILKVKDKLGSFNAIGLPILGGAVPAFIGLFLLPYVSMITTYIGDLINSFTHLEPKLMSVLIAIAFAMLIVSPISTVAIGLAIGLNGLAAGAAAIGVTACTAILLISSVRVNKIGTTLAILFGAMKMMLPNLVRNPIMLVPSVITGAISGFVAALLNIQGIPASAGFGLVGLVGPIHAVQQSTANFSMAVLSTILAFIIVPFGVGWVVDYLCRNVFHLYKTDIFKYEA
ncbi:PTS transporter subunit IIC [Vagococcus intermedius]|uniref:PTS sugar transporter subunit IIC n=1 Tax=Vagococcus intermedius TaxID=2991418 RepID=A0AAF0CVY1_9ENTE|nr:PTS sugar transporter subunit IIC [Vagococcus intermedius]WEG73998.1 PTS sugar transporter subunit IIC [Vagococcus intermedius]WEG76078.1 PTS sugar transporter subunit IIC [Vagococcus intermedius]